MSYPTHTLMNFNIPKHLKDRFDQIVKFKQVSKTSILNILIEEYCRKETGLIRETEQLDSFIRKSLQIHQSKSPDLPRKKSSKDDSYDELLDIFLTN